MKKRYIFYCIGLLAAISCSKDDNYCYECSATNRFTSEVIVEQECDLSKESRDQKVNSFTSQHDNYANGWTVSCSKTSE